MLTEHVLVSHLDGLSGYLHGIFKVQEDRNLDHQAYLLGMSGRVPFDLKRDPILEEGDYDNGKCSLKYFFVINTVAEKEPKLEHLLLLPNLFCLLPGEGTSS